ncbi:hypothetical protein SAMD00023353_10700010 [Rosellinia necatrix]|uniref:Uncharacterized protein n=1 Tax=Rosellinia necatrix TaxID=77044 RepID=A0A1S8ABB9_ROSNE|nr:hypothetical protein SAMD00023353_10700010 [Rosellinia necatrix]
MSAFNSAMTLLGFREYVSPMRSNHRGYVRRRLSASALIKFGEAPTNCYRFRAGSSISRRLVGDYAGGEG